MLKANIFQTKVKYIELLKDIFELLFLRIDK